MGTQGVESIGDEVEEVKGEIAVDSDQGVAVGGMPEGTVERTAQGLTAGQALPRTLGGNLRTYEALEH